MVQIADAQTWFAPYWSDCLVERFAHGAVVHFPCAATTHYLNELSLWVMECLGHAPLDVAMLAARLDGEGEGEVMSALKHVVDHLAMAGLLVPWEE